MCRTVHIRKGPWKRRFTNKQGISERGIVLDKPFKLRTRYNELQHKNHNKMLLYYTLN